VAVNNRTNDELLANASRIENLLGFLGSMVKSNRAPEPELLAHLDSAVGELTFIIRNSQAYYEQVDDYVHPSELD